MAPVPAITLRTEAELGAFSPTGRNTAVVTRTANGNRANAPETVSGS
jgi:hypothetical protein